MTTLSSTTVSLVRKSAPMVALYWVLNFLFTWMLVWGRNKRTDVLIHEGCLADTAYISLWYMREKGRYPLSPRMMTLRRAFRRGAAMAGEGV